MGGSQPHNDPFAPSILRQASATPERWARYDWAATLAAGATVLDAGCGLGSGAALLADQADRVVGIDIAAPTVEEARWRHGSRANFVEGDIGNLPFAPATFDLVVCFETIEQVPQVDRSLDELHRVLRPDGLLLISSANKAAYPAGNPLHLHELTSDELRTALKGRFASVAIQHQSTYWASFLGSESALQGNDPLSSIEANVRKSQGNDPGSELYAVAVAGDGELPPMSSWVVLGDNAHYEDQRQLAALWRDRAVRAEADAFSARVEREFLQAREQAALERADAAERALEEYRSRASAPNQREGT